MTRMLASVANLAEAQLIAREQVDFIDLKEPARGALGGLPPDAVRHIIATLKQDGCCACFSATIGDLPLLPRQVIPAVTAMARTGVDYVKIGLFPGGDADGVIGGLEPLMAAGTRLIAVLFGEDPLETGLIQRLDAAGFSGVMLDTRNKQRGSLTQQVSPARLQTFMTTARTTGLLVGLAGSLTPADLPQLLALKPDYLGFRGALCRGARTSALEPERVSRIRRIVAGEIGFADTRLEDAYRLE